MRLVPAQGESYRFLELPFEGEWVQVLSFTPSGSVRETAQESYRAIVPAILEEMRPELSTSTAMTEHDLAVWTCYIGWYVIVYLSGDYVASLRIMPPDDNGWTGPDRMFLHPDGDAEDRRIEIGGFTMRKKYRANKELRCLFADGVKQLVDLSVPEEGTAVARTVAGKRERLFKLWSGLETHLTTKNCPFYGGGLTSCYLKGDAATFRERVTQTYLATKEQAHVPALRRRPPPLLGGKGHEDRGSCGRLC